MGQYAQPHTQAWAQKIASLDGFVIVTPEYNRSVPGALKNALDFLYAEWTNKAVGFVSYGSTGGTRAVEHLRLIAGELQMADVRSQVALPLQRLRELQRLKPIDAQHDALATTLGQVIAWTNALAPLRAH